ncbi:MAG TPA: methyltransferase domain-containing protein [Xanthomonadales bacterium]|nr:methyltransferase domain-containing protein [Xanthomonadales bacterium]
MDLKESGTIGGDADRHWYFASKARAVRRVLGNHFPAQFVDVGAGTGFFSRWFLDHTPAVAAWSVDSGYERDADERRDGGKVVHFRRSIDRVDARLVLLMDVLEHVDDDVGLLREYVARVPRGSRFLVTVPAFRWLWSAHDDFLEHKRRYTLREAEAVVRAAGLRAISGHYYFAGVFPLAAAVRLAHRKVDPPRSLLVRHGALANASLGAISRLETAVMRFNRAFGLTVVCVAESE